MGIGEQFELEKTGRIVPETKFVDYKKLLRSLLNKVNRVTSPYRHGRSIRPEDLNALCERQIEVEREINE
jgi:hypothetical protein